MSSPYFCCTWSTFLVESWKCYEKAKVVFFILFSWHAFFPPHTHTHRQSVPVQFQYFLPTYPSSSYPLTHTYTPITSSVSTIRQYPGTTHLFSFKSLLPYDSVTNQIFGIRGIMMFIMMLMIMLCNDDDHTRWWWPIIKMLDNESTELTLTSIKMNDHFVLLNH